ncbi:hypothetical protein ACFE04_025860 [Oxalis oulophora]
MGVNSNNAAAAAAAAAAGSLLSRLLKNKHKHKPNHNFQGSSSSLSLTTTIINHINSNYLQKAVSILSAAPQPIPYSLYSTLFSLCATTRSIIEARKVESHLVTFSPTPPTFLLNRAIETYGKCRCLPDATELFDEMPKRDGGSWNALISAYVHNGCAAKALCLFSRMNKDGVFANEVTFASVVASCGVELDFALAMQVHCSIVKYGFCGNVILESSLVDVYGKCRLISDSRRMFDEIESPNNVSWNVIVRRYLEAGEEKEAVVMFSRMLRADVRPLNHTFSNTLVACSRLRQVMIGVQIHGVTVKLDYEQDEVVSSSLIDMYIKCGDLESAHGMFDHADSKNLISWTSIVSGYAKMGKTQEARKLFDEMPERNVISWNVMLAGYAHSLQWEEALAFVYLMRKTTKEFDSFTLSLILNVSTGLSDIELGKQVHAFSYRHNSFSNISVANALLDMYGKCGNLRKAQIWFYQMSQWRDSFSWNALLTSYARHGMGEHAMTIFGEMQWEKTRPSKFTFGTLLAACANTSALELGKQIHGFMIRNSYEMDVVVTGALVDMYCKCRCLHYALTIFRETASRDLVLWNSIIFGCCYNGRGSNVFELFLLMAEEGVTPDHVTFRGILLACVYEGHIELAERYFNQMSDEYYVMPRLEHYECMIELYCRHGCMDELDRFITKMSFDPTVSMLRRIFDACSLNGYEKLGRWAAERLTELNPDVPFRYETTEGTRPRKMQY